MGNLPRRRRRRRLPRRGQVDAAWNRRVRPRTALVLRRQERGKGRTGLSGLVRDREQADGPAPPRLLGGPERRLSTPRRSNLGRDLPARARNDHVFGLLVRRQHRLPPPAGPL